MALTKSCIRDWLERKHRAIYNERCAVNTQLRKEHKDQFHRNLKENNDVLEVMMEVEACVIKLNALSEKINLIGSTITNRFRRTNYADNFRKNYLDENNMPRYRIATCEELLESIFYYELDNESYNEIEKELRTRFDNDIQKYSKAIREISSLRKIEKIIEVIESNDINCTELKEIMDGDANVS